MTLDGLLAVLAIIIALYALSRPIQQQSVKLFVSYAGIACSLAFSALLLLTLDGLAAWHVNVAPLVSFPMRVAALGIPVGVALRAVYQWRRAVLSEDKDPRFREFIYTSLRENCFDELVRILTTNVDCLADVLSEETAVLLFDRRLIRAFVASRSWLHLDLLADRRMLDLLPDRRVAVDWTIRELLATESSPIHAMVAAAEGCDESCYCSPEESDLIERTFLNPDWYLSCGPNYTAVMVAVENLDSGTLDKKYNENDRLYIASQGVSSRSRCPIFLAQKMVTMAIRQAVWQHKDGDFFVTDLADLFAAVYDHSLSDEGAWDASVSEFSEFPTPFAYLMSGICLDLYFLSKDAMREADSGSQPPSLVAKSIGWTWSACMWHLMDRDGHVPDSFRWRLLQGFFAYLLEIKDLCEQRSRPTPPPLPAWYEVQLKPFKETCLPRDEQGLAFLTQVIQGMDLGKDYIRTWQRWLCSELGLDNPRVRERR